MKKLIFILFLFAGFAKAQTVASSNPFIVDPTGTTVFEVNLGGKNTVQNPSPGGKYPTVIFITVPAANVGTVQWNSVNSTLTSSPVYSASSEDKIYILTIKDKFYIKFSNAADFVHITW